MDNVSIKERICNLLESIVNKTESINKSSSPDYLIEVDLVIDDLKELYKQFLLLKKVTEEDLEKHPGLKDKDRLGSTEPAGRTFPRTFVTPPPGKEKGEHGSKKEDDRLTDDVNDTQAASKKSDDDVSATEKREEKSAGENNEKPDAAVEEKPPAVAEKDVDKHPDEQVKIQYPQKEDDVAKEPQHETEKNSSQKTGNTLKKSKNKSVADVADTNKNKALGDKYVADEDTSLNVRLAKMKQEVAIGTSMQHKPIVNLKEGIGVNEKFLFINELFEGDIEAYNEAVNKLNSFDNLDEAFNYINQLNESYSWDGQNSSDTIDKFAYLVQRRYMTK